MNVTFAEFKDLPEILAIQKLAFYDVAKFYNNFKLGPLLVTINDLEASFKYYTYLKITIDERIVGSVRSKVEKGICKIENLLVLPEFQNRGIGKKLIEHIEVTNRDCEVFKLFTGKNTPKNVTFYKSMGYEVMDEINATDREPMLVIMTKCGESEKKDEK